MKKVFAALFVPMLVFGGLALVLFGTYVITMSNDIEFIASFSVIFGTVLIGIYVLFGRPGLMRNILLIPFAFAAMADVCFLLVCAMKLISSLNTISLCWFYGLSMGFLAVVVGVIFWLHELCHTEVYE